MGIVYSAVPRIRTAMAMILAAMVIVLLLAPMIQNVIWNNCTTVTSGRKAADCVFSCAEQLLWNGPRNRGMGTNGNDAIVPFHC